MNLRWEGERILSPTQNTWRSICLSNQQDVTSSSWMPGRTGEITDPKVFQNLMTIKQPSQDVFDFIIDMKSKIIIWEWAGWYGDGFLVVVRFIEVLFTSVKIHPFSYGVSWGLTHTHSLCYHQYVEPFHDPLAPCAPLQSTPLHSPDPGSLDKKATPQNELMCKRGDP